MAYIPDWESLADALKRLIETGTTEAEAKVQLCHAMADRKIDVRVRLALSDYLYSGSNVQIPVDLNPSHFDWDRSQPLEWWLVGPKLGLSGWERRPLNLVQLSTANVIDVFCEGIGRGCGNKPAAGAVRQKGHGRNRPAVERARSAIAELYPKGVPEQAKEPNTHLCRRVIEKLKRANLPVVSDDTILRAAGRRK